MISREEAREEAEQYKWDNNPVGALEIVEMIYDSIGTCQTCKRNTSCFIQKAITEATELNKQDNIETSEPSCSLWVSNGK